MLQKISQMIIDSLIKKHKILPNEQDLYNYGLQLIISNLAAFVMVIIMGLLFHQLLWTLCFLVLFYGVRYYGGGYHAKTMLRCMFLTLLVHILFILLLKYQLNCYLYLWVMIIPIYIYRVPQNPDILLSQVKKYKIINKVMMCLGCVISLWTLKYSNLSLTVTYAFAVTAISNLGGGHKNVEDY